MRQNLFLIIYVLIEINGEWIPKVKKTPKEKAQAAARRDLRLKFTKEERQYREVYYFCPEFSSSRFFYLFLAMKIVSVNFF